VTFMFALWPPLGPTAIPIIVLLYHYRFRAVESYCPPVGVGVVAPGGGAIVPAFF